MRTALLVSCIHSQSGNNTRCLATTLLFLISLMLVLLLPSSVQATYETMPVADKPNTPGDPPIAEIEFVDYVGSGVTAFTVHGDYVYIGVGTEVIIVDISELSTPNRVGQILLDDIITNILVDSGEYLYVITETYLQVMEIIQPDHLIQRGRYTFPIRSPYGKPGATILSPYIYVSTAGMSLDYRLTVINISDPDQLVATDFNGLWYRDMTISRGFLYGAVGIPSGFSGPSTLQIWDISAPNSPTKIYDYHDGNWPIFQTIAIFGQYAYIRGGDKTVVIDISVPAMPRQVALWDFSVQIVIDHFAYTMYSVLDISDPAAPVIRSALPVPLYGLSPELVDNSIYTISGINLLRIVDVTDRVSPILTGSYRLQLQNLGGPFVVQADIVYPGGLTSYAISDDYLYRVYQVCSKWCGPVTLEILDVSEPSQTWPVLGTLTLPHLPSFITVQQDRLFLVGQPYGEPFQMYIIDISVPSNPALLGIHTEPWMDIYESVVAVSNDHVFIKSHGEGIKVIDISVPSTPQQVAMIPAPEIAGIGVVQNYLFTSQIVNVEAEPYHYEWIVYDISDPVHPNQFGSIGVQSSATWFKTTGPYLYAANFDGLSIYDASNPARLEKIASYAGYNYETSVILNKNYIFFLAGVGEFVPGFGLRVLWFSPPIRKAISVDNSETLAVPDGPAYIFPANSFSQPVTITHQARYPKNIPSVGSLTATDIVFKAQASDSAGQLAPLQTSYSLTVPYTSQQVAAIIPETLSIYFWDGDTWQREASSHVDMEGQVITAQPNRMGIWAVMGESYHCYLPTVRSSR